MAKPFTESIDYVYQWLNDTNRISENLGDPVNVYVADGDYSAHNALYPAYLINESSYVHDTLEQNAVVRSLNDLNDRKVQRSGDVITGNFRVNQNVIIDQDLIVQGGDILSSAATFNILNTPSTVNAFLASTVINIGAGTGTSTFNHDVSINGGDLLTNKTTFNLLNDTATTINALGAGIAITIGATTGTTTVRNNAVITGDLAVNGGDVTSSASTFNLLNSGSISTLNIGNSATTITLGAATGTTTVNNSLTVAGGSGQSFIVNDGVTSKFTVDSSTGNSAVAGTLNVTGASTFLSTLQINSNLTLGGNITFSTGAVAIDTNTTLTSANIFTSGSTTVSFNIGTGATATGQTKTLNLATGGVAGSLTNINIGSTQGGTIVFNTPNMQFAGVTVNGVIHTMNSTGAVGILGTATARQMLLSGASAAPTWSTLTIPTTVSANSFLFAKSANVLEDSGFISSDSTLDFDYSIPGKVNLRTTGSMPTSILVIGDLRVGSNKNGTYSQTGTSTVTVVVAAHGMLTGNWAYLDFTSGTGVDGAYAVTIIDADTFTVQASVQTTSGNVVVEIGGTGNISKVLTIGADDYDPYTALYVKAYDATQVTTLLKIQDALGNNKVVVEPSGKTTINGDLHIQGNIVNTGASGAVVTQGIVEDPVTTTSTASTTLLSIPAATYRSVEFQVQVVEGTKYWTSKILAIHDGTNVNWTEYGMAGIGTPPVSSYTVNIVSGNIVLAASSASASSTTYKIVATAMMI